MAGIILTTSPTQCRSVNKSMIASVICSIHLRHENALCTSYVIILMFVVVDVLSVGFGNVWTSYCFIEYILLFLVVNTISECICGYWKCVDISLLF